MKTSIIIGVAILLNTTLLVAEPLSVLINGVNPFLLLGVEVLLVVGYLINSWLKKLNKACTIDLGYLDIFVIK